MVSILPSESSSPGSNPGSLTMIKYDAVSSER